MMALQGGQLHAKRRISGLCHLGSAASQTLYEHAKFSPVRAHTLRHTQNMSAILALSLAIAPSRCVGEEPYRGGVAVVPRVSLVACVLVL